MLYRDRPQFKWKKAVEQKMQAGNQREEIAPDIMARCSKKLRITAQDRDQIGLHFFGIYARLYERGWVSSNKISGFYYC